MSERPTQTEYWNTIGGPHWSAFADRYDEILRPFGDAVVEAAGIERAHRVLDIGCGNGALALEIAGRVGEEGHVLGVDLSGPMLEVARTRAAGMTNVAFHQGDAQRHPFEAGSFDRAVSRFGVMFFDDPAAAFANVCSALRPGGLLCFVCWQDALANEWIMVPGAAIVEHAGMPDLGEPGAPGPFAFADPARARAILEGAGFTDVTTDPVVLPQRFGRDTDDTVAFLQQTDLAKQLLDGVEDHKRDAIFASIRQALDSHVRDDGVYLEGSAWLVSARRPARAT